MPRLLGYFALVLAASWLLRHVPYVGRLFGGFFGFYVTLALFAIVSALVGKRLLARRKLRGQIRALGHVDTAYNQGKLGSLLLASGRVRKALEPLARAMEGEPQNPEWPYRLAEARLAVGDPAGARDCLARVLALEPNYGYGSARLRLAEAEQRLKNPEAVLAALTEYERAHGPSPQSAYQSAKALEALGRTDEARTRRGEVRPLYDRLPDFQRRTQRRYWLRAVAGL